MVDIPGNASTTRTIATGGTVSDTLEVAGDTDWFRIQLVAGQQISVLVEGLTLADPIVRVRNAAGTVIFQNDDWGEGLNSYVAFQVPATGTYYIDVGSAPNNQTGTYRLSVMPYAAPPLGTIDDIAGQLTHGYWNGDAHHFDVSANRSITVNLTGLDPAGLAIARQALAIWTDTIGVVFPEVVTGGQIVFGQADEGTGAFSTAEWAGGITSTATVNVAPSRLGLHTYLHEIAHALGLGHAGDYNGGTAFSRYPYEAMFLNDGAAVSIMSYFDNGESSYYSGLGFTNSIIVTPQLADIVAMGNLYGLSTTTRTGDTIYGFNNTSGREIFNAAQNPNVAYTLFDSGGTDTLDYSGFGQSQLINLNPESFSNVGSGVGNVSIARGVIIENAVGGGGNDLLIGNSASNTLSGRGGADTFTGGSGDDTFRDTTSNLNGDTITDFGAGDRIVFTNATLPGFAFALSGTTLSFSGGSLILAGGISSQLVVSAHAGGGVQLTLEPDARNDFNGDGRSDILWRDNAGQFQQWQAQLNGGFTSNPAASGTVPTSWFIGGIGDFNGDGRDDILWRSTAGGFQEWLGEDDGGFVGNPNATGAAPTNWSIAGTGDFNGDGRDDILWRSTTGHFQEWLGQDNGSFVGNPNASGFVPTSYRVTAVGHFNSDGRDDILWRADDGGIVEWLGQPNGGFANNPFVSGSAPGNWQVVGAGDFNGDTHDDILWRSSTGDFQEWLGQANGGFVGNAKASGAVPTSWQIDAIGDYNGDGRDDILWRSTAGDFQEWLAHANGGFVGNPSASGFVLTDWQILSPNIYF